MSSAASCFGVLATANRRSHTTTVVSSRVRAEIRLPTSCSKARDLKAIARRIVETFDGAVPDSIERLMEFRGVGPKIAALTLAVGFGKPAIAVDVHVHRVTNRWGYVHTATPEETMAALLEKLPKRYWIEINERLVPFGKHICVAARPYCSTCPLLSMCRQVGVVNPR